MTPLFLLSIAVCAFLLVAGLILVFSGGEEVEARLEEIAAQKEVNAPDLTNQPSSGLARGAASLAGFFKPVSSITSGSNEDLSYRLALAGFRRPAYTEIFSAIKLILPVLGVVAGTFWRSNMITGILIGAIFGYFGPDLALGNLIKRRQESIRLAMPDAVDLLVICMEAGLGIDQALVRIGDEIGMTSPALAEEFQIINREQRAGKPRLDAWRAMAERVDLEAVRQFVAMLIQTERFGTPIAHALGQFADNMRVRRTQAAEETAAKAGVKLLFPLVIFIFPSIFVVTLGPAILNIQKSFEQFFNK